MSLVAPPPPRSPWQRVYGAAHRWRRHRARSRASRLPRLVVSIGNLHLGGTGKTPMTAAVARHLIDRGLRVAILSRGYGRSDPKSIHVVSQGDGPLLGPSVAGDEPVLLAGLVPDAAVVVGAARHRAGRHAMMRLDNAPDVFLLDDGFAHVRLARDLDILLFPASDPFAGGRLLPSGRLREPLASARYADAAVLTGGSADADVTRGEDLAAALRPYGFDGPGFVAPTRADPIRRVDGMPLEPRAKVLLVSAIARPERFENLLLETDFEVAGHLRFRDHHGYPHASLRMIRSALRTAGAAVVVTTAKDRVKLQGRLDLPLAELPVRTVPEPAFFTWLDDQLALLPKDAGERPS